MIALYTSVMFIVFYTPHHTHATNAAIIVPTLAVAVFMYWREYATFIRICNNGHHTDPASRNRISEIVLFTIVNLDPVNYLFDRAAHAYTQFSFWVHILQITLRFVFALIVVTIPFMWQDYENAWACYGGHLHMRDYDLGVCPAADGGHYFQSWVCSEPGNYDQDGCEGIPPPTVTWKTYPPAFHTAVLCTAYLYGFHAAAGFLDFHERFKTVFAPETYGYSKT